MILSCGHVLVVRIVIRVQVAVFVCWRDISNVNVLGRVVNCQILLGELFLLERDAFVSGFYLMNFQLC